MQVQEHHIVTLVYELRNGHAQGELLEIMDYNWPLIFYYGAGAMLPAFEAKLEGLSPNTPFEFTLSPEEAYGPKKSELIFDVSLDTLTHIYGKENMPLPGEFVSITNQNGELKAGRVVSKTKTGLQVDCNHQMAGIHLHFKGMLMDVRKASVDELIHKRYIEPDGVRF